MTSNNSDRAILSQSLSMPLSIHVEENEGKPFEVQALSFSQADVVISIHGAGETNVLFMRPCSVLIEIYPWRYTPVYFFHGLATKVAVIHEYWEANRTVNYPQFANAHIQQCNKHFRPMWEDYRPDNETHNTELANACDENDACSSCARLVPNVYISIEKLKEKLTNGLRKRSRCLNRLVKAGVYEFVKQVVV